MFLNARVPAPVAGRVCGSSVTVSGCVVVVGVLTGGVNRDDVAGGTVEATVVDVTGTVVDGTGSVVVVAGTVVVVALQLDGAVTVTVRGSENPSGQENQTDRVADVCELGNDWTREPEPPAPIGDGTNPGTSTVIGCPASVLRAVHVEVQPPSVQATEPDRLPVWASAIPAWRNGAATTAAATTSRREFIGDPWCVKGV
jgi:hypothetical protein